MCHLNLLARFAFVGWLLSMEGRTSDTEQDNGEKRSEDYVVVDNGNHTEETKEAATLQHHS